MKILIIGGHLSPALALIDLIGGKHDILFVGRKYVFEGDETLSLEYKLSQELGIKFAPITTGRLQRSFTRYTIPSLLKFPLGLGESFKILRSYKPDVIVGFGGYVSLPVIFAAFLLRIPIVIHEQTLEAGVANKIASVFAKKICISFDRSKQFFPRGKTILTGNPIREQIQNPDSNLVLPEEFIPMIYITGGSLGSIVINNLALNSLKELLSRFRIVHQTGGFNNFESLTKLKKFKKVLSNEMRKRYLVSDHFSSNDVGLILREASLVVGRSGINTVTELLFLNKPALLIPLPKSARDEQKKNAQFLKDVGLCEVLNERSITPSDFVSAINHMIRNIEKYKINDNKDYLKENASLNILGVVENVAKNNQKTS